ncbi:MAG: hypothetical protein HC815_19575 [Richelia sp. RM1_1_1]|nr:hypothetical protein [Richelia sp. RM1_1_1]
MNTPILNQIKILYAEVRRLESLVYEDDLTQIGNRRKFERDYQEVLVGDRPYQERQRAGGRRQKGILLPALCL